MKDKRKKSNELSVFDVSPEKLRNTARWNRRKKRKDRKAEVDDAWSR